MKDDANNTDYEIFYEIVLSILNTYVPLKKKYLRRNPGAFATKKFRKALMKRVYFKDKLK